MDTESTKQIIIAYYAIQSACDAILKPIRIELGDSETVAEMPKAMRYALEVFSGACEGIQEVLSEELSDYISEFEKDVDADEELAAAGEMISDILFDIKPIPNQPISTDSNPPFELPKNVTNMIKFAEKVVMGGK